MEPDEGRGIVRARGGHGSLRIFLFGARGIGAENVINALKVNAISLPHGCDDFLRGRRNWPSGVPVSSCVPTDEWDQDLTGRNYQMTVSLRALSVAAVLAFGSLSGAAVIAQDAPMVGGAALLSAAGYTKIGLVTERER